MNELRAKICYEISTGNVLFITTEYIADVQERHKDYYMEVFTELRKYSMDEINFIDLDYETYAVTFANIKSYSVNPKTKTLDCIYFTQTELDSVAQEQQIADTLINKILTISEYIKIQNEQSISNIEDYILESEKNKIINGGM